MKVSVFTSIGVMGALGLLATMPVHALGLGKIELSSALNEPFRAEIPVNAIQGDDAETLQVRLASDDEFERAGLVKNAAITQLKFKVVQKAGKTVITVMSKNAVKEPLLDFLLMAKTSNGQLIREYTVLLDPPKSVFKQAARTAKVVSSPNRSQPKSVITEPVQRVEPIRSSVNANQYGPTSNTDTLWDIALKTRPSRDVTVHQMMIALVDKNANAFIKNNINGLKRGYTLAVPSLSEVTQLTRQQAAAAVKQQNMAWKNRNVANKVAASTISTQAVEQVTQAEPVNQPEQALPSTEVESRNGEPTARLQLLGSNDEKLLSENDLAAFGNEQVKALSDQLTVAQEVIESQQQENIDIKARMAAMEEQIQTLRKLISLQDPDLARLQSKLEQESVEQAASTLEEMAAVLNDSVSNIDELPSEEAELDAADASLALNTDEAVVEGENGPETVLQETMAETASIASEQSNVSSLAVNPSESNQEPITDAPSATLLEKVQALLVEHKMKALLAGLAFLLGLLLLNRRKAEDARTTWDEAIEKLDGNKASKPVSAVAAVAPVDKDIAVEPESDFDTVKTVDDLIKDADIYVSYGDFDKAGQVLAEAYDDEPTNLLVIQKLLFTHYKQAKTSAFVELARQYTVDRDSMEWAEVAEWGRELDPENVLFEEASIEAEANDEIVALAPSLAFDVSSESEQDNSRLELGQEEKEDTTQATEDEALLAFTSYVDVDETEVSDMAEESESDTSLDSTIPELDLTLSDDNDFEIDGLDAMTEGDLEAATLAMSDNSADDDLAFDLGDFDAVDEAETKLDLASAYIEMGDPEGAKSILQEVMSEGDDDQKSRAKTLLNDL